MAPSWMGSRRRNWSPGLWSPAVPLLPVPGPAPGLFFCYLCAWRDDKTPGVIIYDIVCCPNWAALAALAAALGLDRLMDYLRRLGKWMREHAQEIAIAIGVAVALVIAVALIILFWAEIAAGVAALLAALAAGLAALAALFSGLLAPAAVAAAILLIVIGMMESEGPGEEEPGRIAPLAAAGGAGGAPAGAGGEAGPVAAAGPGPPGGGAAGKTGPPEEASA